MNRNIFFMILLILFFVRCEEYMPSQEPEIDQSEPFKEIINITGLRLTDANGQALGLWREPNDNPGNNLVFPNPSNGRINPLDFTDSF